MKFILIFIVTFLLGTLFGYKLTSLYFLKVSGERVLSQKTEIVNISITPIPTLKLDEDMIIEPSPTDKPVIRLTPTPSTKVILPPKEKPEVIHGYIERFSGQYAVDPNVLRHIAICESGFNPLAINGPYAGLYQFNVTTWINNRRDMGEDTNPDLRFNSEEAIQTAAYLVSKGRKGIWPNCYP